MEEADFKDLIAIKFEELQKAECWYPYISYPTKQQMLYAGGFHTTKPTKLFSGMKCVLVNGVSPHQIDQKIEPAQGRVSLEYLISQIIVMFIKTEFCLNTLICAEQGIFSEDDIILKKKLDKVEGLISGNRSILGAFNHKIRYLQYCGILDKDKFDKFDDMSAIRNAFAHQFNFIDSQRIPDGKVELVQKIVKTYNEGWNQTVKLIKNIKPDIDAWLKSAK